MNTNFVAPSAKTGMSIQGEVRGGQQPLVGAHIYLFAAGTTGYGGPGIAASSTNASVSLLNAGLTGGSDAVGAYVVTDANGAFSISGDYTCTPGAQVYLYALGGNPGPGTNASAGLMAALGNCPAAGNFAAATPFVVVNEVSTIATAYAMAGFASDATHVSSSGTTLAQTGIANAFANVTNLETLSTGAALTTTPAGNGSVPQSEIYSLADALAACVNSDGTVSGPTNPTACYTLFTNAESGGTTGTQPTDTATAAINIAHNPAESVVALYGLTGATPPFQPTLSAAPNDWTLGVTYSPAGLEAQAMAIDASGNAWFPVAVYHGSTNTSGPTTTGPYSLMELSSQGAVLSGANGYTGGGLTLYGILAPTYSIALDPAGNAWVAGASNVYEFSSSGAVLSGASGFPVGGVNAPHGIAMDGQGNAWVANGASLVKMDPSGNILSGTSGFATGIGSWPEGVTIDESGNAWSGAGYQSSLSVLISEMTNSGALLSGSGYSVSTASPQAIAFDSTGNAWMNLPNVSGQNNLTKLSSSGVELSPSGGYKNCIGPISLPGNLTRTCIWWDSDPFAVDGAGNVWGEVTYQISQNSMVPATRYSTAISEISNTGTILSGANGYTGATTLGPGNPPIAGSFGASPIAIAIDGSGNLWTLVEASGATIYTGTQVIELIGAATPVITPFSLGVKNGTVGMRP